MTSAQTWPKTAIFSWQSPFNDQCKFIKLTWKFFWILHWSFEECWAYHPSRVETFWGKFWSHPCTRNKCRKITFSLLTLRESNKRSEERQEPTLGFRFRKVSVLTRFIDSLKDRHLLERTPRVGLCLSILFFVTSLLEGHSQRLNGDT